MKRFITHLWHRSRSETGAVTPIMMMMSGILFITGMALLGISASQVNMMGGKTARIQARYYAEQAARISLWRMTTIDAGDWDQWVTFSDSVKSATYDGSANTILGVGHYGGVTDSVVVGVEVDTLTARRYLAHVILYKKNLTLGPDGTLSYPFEENAPQQIRGWAHGRKSKKFRYKHLIGKSGKFFKKSKKHGKSKKKDFLHTYNGNQTFSGPMEDGIHIVKGNAHLHDGTVLNGTTYPPGRA